VTPVSYRSERIRPQGLTTGRRQLHLAGKKKIELAPVVAAVGLKTDRAELVKQETDILVRINDLRIALRDMKSEDVREAIQAAIWDCERQLRIDGDDGGDQSPRFAM
jgi:hypothetical protein